MSNVIDFQKEKQKRLYGYSIPVQHSIPLSQLIYDETENVKFYIDGRLINIHDDGAKDD